MKTVLLVGWVLSVLVAGSLAGAVLINDEHPLTSGPDPACEPGAELDFDHRPDAPQPGERVIFTAQGPLCGDRMAVWILPELSEPLYGSRVEHTFDTPGPFSVTLLLLGGHSNLDLTRIVEVVAPDATSVLPHQAPLEAQPGIQYIFEEPKHLGVEAALNISTLPVRETPFTWGIGGHVLHVNFDVRDSGFLVEGLVIYEDYKGIATCGIQFQAENFTYEGDGHYQAIDHQCVKQISGYAERVYLGVCVEFDGEVIPPEEWEQEGNVVHADKMDRCWQGSLRTPFLV